MPSLLRTLIFSTARLSVSYTCVKAGTARLIGVPRQTYLVVLGTAAVPAPFTLFELAVPKNSGTRTKILAACRAQKRYSVNGVYM